MIEENTVQFSDLFLVAYLLCKDYKISETRVPYKDHTEFVFHDSEELQKDADNFLSGNEITINLLAFLKMYKNLLFLVKNPSFSGQLSKEK